MSIEAPKAIFFDLDGTLLDGSTDTVPHIRTTCEKACTERPQLAHDDLFEAIMRHRREFWLDRERARIGRLDIRAAVTQMFGGALAELGSRDDPFAARLASFYRDLRDGAMRLYPGAIEVLQTLRRRGAQTALITNGGGAQQRARVDRFGLAPYFDCIVIEGEFGCGKPDERVFRHALTMCGVEPSGTWMVGDNLEADIATPRALGMHTIWIDEAGAGVPADAPARPHRVIREITELIVTASG